MTLDEKIDKYLKDNTKTIVEDIKGLVKIPSVTGTPEAIDAMKAALKLSERFGFKTKNHKNVMGIADLKGKSDKQIGIIGHMDVVPPGNGWNLDPYDVTYTQNYLVGRGVLDDKGPNVMMLHAINFLRENNFDFKYSIRYLFGTDEETGTTDVDTFKKDFDEPDIVISPDGDFPVCYGEKGLLRIRVSSPKIENSQYKKLYAGFAENAVAGQAYVIVDNDRVISKKTSRLAHAINIDTEEDTIKITAKGRSAHAAEPYESIDSIAVLSQFLLEQNIGSDQEIEFLKFICMIAGKPDGKGIGIDCSDEDFGGLTIIPSKLRMKNGQITQSFDCRYPMCADTKKIINNIKNAAPKGSKIETVSEVVPYIIDKNHPLIQTLKRAYEDAMGQEAKLFTMGGFTYAREFRCGASFGPYMEWVPRPAWVGSLHGPDEGVAAKVLHDTFKIYVYALKYLMELDL